MICVTLEGGGGGGVIPSYRIVKLCSFAKLIVIAMRTFLLFPTSTFNLTLYVQKALNVDYNRTTLFELMSTMNSSGGASNMTSLTDYLISSSKEGLLFNQLLSISSSDEVGS